MRKYLKKHTAIYRFKFDVLDKTENSSLSDDTKNDLWQIYLYGMMKNKLISHNQALTWKYPTKELK